MLSDGLLKVEMPDGSVWKVPLLIILGERIKYRIAEMNTSIEDAQELTIKEMKGGGVGFERWLNETINWNDIQAYARLLKCGSNKYAAAWADANKTIVWVD